MKRWVGLGVIADNVINIGRAMEKSHARSQPQKMPLQKTAGHPGGLCYVEPY